MLARAGSLRARRLTKLQYASPDLSSRRLFSFLQVFGGLVASATFILVLGWVSMEVFPNTSRGQLRMPSIPALGMLGVAAVAMKLSKSESTRGWSLGLWTGGLLSLALYLFYVIGMGYFNLFVVP